MSKVILVCSVISISLLAFMYGLTVGFYKIPPFGIILSVKNRLGNVLSPQVTFDSVGGKDNVLTGSGDRVTMVCPKQTYRTGVIVSFGQSNAANSAEHRFSPDDVPDVINWYDGKCYKAQSPLLGATNTHGEWISIASQKLVDNGTFDKVVVLSLAIGGSPVSAWSPGSELNKRLLDKMQKIGETYTVTDMIWHQGESDAAWGVSQAQYFKTFASISAGIRTINAEAPIFMSIASYCNGGKYPNSITDAQLQLVKLIEGIELGVNTDLLISPSMRHDGCHLTYEGQIATADRMAEIIGKYHR